MKKILLLILSVTVLTLAGCGNEQKPTDKFNWDNTYNSQYKTGAYGCKDGFCYVKATSKWVKRYDNKDYYLIGTNAGTFKISDSLLYMNFSSSDGYAIIEPGTCYIFKTHPLSFRIPFLSSYKNVVAFKKIECKGGAVNKGNANSGTSKLKQCLTACETLKEDNKNVCIKGCIKEFK